MADTKISALPASTTPLAGTEVLPIVQSSSTKQVSVANLTAGRSFDALGMTLTSTDAGAAAAPTIDLYRDSASPAASDTLGEIEFNGEDSAGNKQAYGLIHASILSPTSTAEQGQLHFETATAGALTEKMIIGTSNLVINEIGSVFNVRIEGDTDANLFYTDATNSRVGIGTISPASKLDVGSGDARISSGNLIIGTTAKGITTGSAIPLGFGVNGSTTQVTVNTSGDFVVGTGFTVVQDINSQSRGRYTATGSPYGYFDYYYGATRSGYIIWDSTSLNLVNLSDYRKKENVVDLTGAIDRLQQLKPRKFNFISDPDKTIEGFVAHELGKVIPQAVFGEKDAVDESGNPVYQAIDQSKLIPLLVASIQELKAEFDAYKTAHP
jgi:hypothetical protein